MKDDTLSGADIQPGLEVEVEGPVFTRGLQARWEFAATGEACPVC